MAGTGDCASEPVVAGGNTLQAKIPAESLWGPTFARARISSSADLSYGGEATDGQRVIFESAGELSLALRSIAENDNKSLEEGGPKLSERYTRTGPSGSERLFVRYGIETLSSSR